MSRYRGVERFGRYRTTQGLFKRKFIPGVEGEGVQIAYPPDYYGNPNINMTGIIIDDITVLETPDVTPKSIVVSLLDNIRVAGINLVNGRPITPELDCDIRIQLTDADDNPLEDFESLTDWNKEQPDNPYTSRIGFEFSAVLRYPIATKVKVTVIGNNGGMARMATFEKIIPAPAENTFPERWIDGIGGNDANDGLSPHKWVGTATYTDSTKRIFATGMFAGYDHTASAAGNATNRFNCGYITGANESGVPVGRFNIAAKISDDEIEVETALGADYTGVTFSTGPKLTPAVTSNTRWRYRGGEYTIPAAVYPTSAEAMDFIAYDGLATFKAAGTGQRLIWVFSSASQTMPASTRFISSNIIWDGEYINDTFSGNITSNVSVANLHILLDRSVIRRSSRTLALEYGYSGVNTQLHQIKTHIHGGEVDSLRNPEGQSKHGAIFWSTNTGSWWRIYGTKIKSSSDDPTFHHYIYPTGDNTHAHAANIHFAEGENNNYLINTNFSREGIRGISFVNNKSDGNSLRAFDASKTNQASPDYYGDIMLMARNRTKLTNEFFYYASVLRARVTQNDVWDEEDDGNNHFLRHNNWALSDSPNFYVSSDGNKVFGWKHYLVETPFFKITATDDVIQMGGNNSVVRAVTDSFGDGLYVLRTNYYTPNRAAPFSLDGVDSTLETYNSLLDGDNFSTNPEWIDPANGRFNA